MANTATSALTDRAGIAIVEQIVSNDLGWIFREQTAVDQGIDAQVEVATDGHGTGRLLALQIKSGASYFRPVKGGWSFYYSARERALWLGHALPVMVVLVDPARHRAYWQRISPETERSTKNRFAVTVPESHDLSKAAVQWELAASGLEARAAERFEAHLRVLPPQVATLLRSGGTDGRAAKLLALLLAEGRLQPSNTVQSLITSPPAWMETASQWPWRAVASFAACHGALSESADALEVAAKAGGPGAGPLLATAALHAAGQDGLRARELLDDAKALHGADVTCAVVEAMLEHPTVDAAPLRTDGVIKAAGATLSDNWLAQTFLAEQASRIRDFATALRYASRALELEPENTETMAQVAQICLHRSGTADAQPDDAARAVDLLGAAVEQRRKWAGPTPDLLLTLAQALVAHGRYSETLRWLLPPPDGTASQREAKDPRLLRLALAAAHLSQSPLAPSIRAELRGDLADRVVQVRLGLLQLSESELTSLWSDEVERAMTSQDWEALLQAVFRLADLGVNASHRLHSLVERGMLPEYTQRLAHAVARLRREPEEALAIIRALAPNDIAATDKLVDTLEVMGRVDEAVAACASAFKRFRDPRFLVQRGLMLFQHGSGPEVESGLREALQVAKAPTDRLELARRLARLEAAAGEWASAEALLADAVSQVDPVPDIAVWNLVQVQLGGAADARAAATISRYRPRCRTRDEAALWYRAVRAVPWDDRLASEAIALATQFAEDPQLATALLTHVVTATRPTPQEATSEGAEVEAEADQESGPLDDRPVVLGDLHRQAFQALDGLIERHGDATGARVLKFTTPEESLAEITELLKAAAPPDLTDLREAIARGQMPAGLLADAHRRPYALALVQRAAGLLFAVASADDEHEHEVQTAQEARGARVVVDVSTLHVLSCLTECDSLVGQVAERVLPRSAREDITRAMVDVHGLAASSGSMAWDRASDRPVFFERTDAEYRLVRSRAEALAHQASRATVADVKDSSLFGDSVHVAEDSPWLAAIELAAQESLTLWCDDVAVRRLARSVGVKAFSTMALLDAWSSARLESAESPEEIEAVIESQERIARELLAEYVVDVPVSTQQLVAQAATDGWQPAAAGLAISRPAWWVWQTDPFVEFRQLMTAVRSGDYKRLPDWQYAGMLGAARAAATPEAARDVLAGLALLGWNDDLQPEPAFDDLMRGCENARRAAETLEGVGDPVLALPAARATLAKTGVERSEEVIRALITDLGTDA